MRWIAIGNNCWELIRDGKRVARLDHPLARAEDHWCVMLFRGNKGMSFLRCENSLSDAKAAAERAVGGGK